MLLWREPVRIGKTLLTRERFDLVGQWVPAFAGKTTKRIVDFRTFHNL